MSKTALIAELNREHREILELVQGFGKNDFEQPGASGEWTSKDVFGHLAHWNGQAAKAIGQALQGERPIAWLDVPVEEINGAEVAARRDHSLYKVMDDFRRSQLALTSLLERASDSQLEQDSEHKTSDGKRATAAWVASELIEHYRTHRAALQAWLAKN